MRLVETPQITVGIPCYNAENTIERAIRSAQGSTLPPLEIIVVDDASTDRSVEIVGMLSLVDARIRLIRHAINRGVAAARNTIIGAARGEFIAFLDDDDEMLPDRLRLQHDLLTKSEAVISS